MQLKFIGRGSAFNTAEGNNNAFYKNKNGQMLLIDCGELTFSAIKEKNLLEGVSQLNVAITHTHSDHFGSLGSLILYMYFALKQKINIILTGSAKQNLILKFLIKNSGISKKYVNYISSKTFTKTMPEFKGFKFVKTPHAKEFNTYAIVYKTNSGITYYSSDTNSTKLLEKYINVDNLDKVYMDTSLADYEGNVHVSFRELKEVVPQNKRHKVYGMHIDNNKLINKLKESGFNVVEKI